MNRREALKGFAAALAGVSVGASVAPANSTDNIKIYRLPRSPERKVYYVDFRDKPCLTFEEYIQTLKLNLKKERENKA